MKTLPLPLTLLLLSLAACKGGSISTDSGLDDSAADDTETEADRARPWPAP